ncbi:hypothetical protein F4861DRAFT_546681 [Xylaria intraflava]|nr:hypothetical protein F4861DRAFT_546681 [Xylaria intraflava]
MDPNDSNEVACAAEPATGREYQASEDESALYYYGLPSSPRLVSRSDGGSVEWMVRIQDQHYVEKEIMPIDPSSCLSDWEETLWPGFHQILESGPAREFWNCVDVLKMGTRGGTDTAIVIWIGVEAGPGGKEISCREGFSVCCRGHEFLESQIGHMNMANIRVEMRRTAVIGSTPSNSELSPTTESAGQGLSIMKPVPTLPFDHESIIGTHGTHHVGNSISVKGCRNRVATSGAYLTIDDDSGSQGTKPTYMLISHHAAFSHDEATVDPTGNSKTAPVEVTMPATATITQLKKAVADQLQSARNKEQRSERGNQSAIERIHHRIDKLNKDRESLEAMESERSRVIGSVVFAPVRKPMLEEPEGIPAKPQCYWLPDFALVKIQGGRINQANLSNDVFVGGVRSGEIANVNEAASNEAEFGQKPLRFEPDAHTPFYPLKTREFVSRSELQSGSLFVGKRGSTTAVTFGCANPLRSVIRLRRDEDGKEERPFDQPLFQHCILSCRNPRYEELFRGNVFSTAGDAGSLVWSLDGRIVGMLDGGAGMTRADGDMVPDTTYVTPMASIMGLIRKEFNAQIMLI